MILACTSGYFGKNCSIPCSPSCNGTCGYKDGTCNDCKDGQESHCTKGCFTSLSFEISLFVRANLCLLICIRLSC